MKRIKTVQAPKEKDGGIISLGKIGKSKRNFLHAEAQINSNGTGAHKNKKAYKRKTKYNDKLMEN